MIARGTFVLLLGAVLGAGMPGGPGPLAQQTADSSPGLPPWAVPVLRLVSATHVVPTTGVVLSPDGLVLVPIEFTAGGEELLVLDGGPDPVRHGRPATVTSRWPLQGLAILQVERLRRPPVILADGDPRDGEVVRLLAFPPAELIESGISSVTRKARLEANGPGLRPAEEGLPNLTGALVNACGQLVGHSAARGVQGMGHTGNTLYRWREALARDLAAAGIELVSAPCDARLELPQPVDEAPAARAEPPARDIENQKINNKNNNKSEIPQVELNIDGAAPAAAPDLPAEEAAPSEPSSPGVLPESPPEPETEPEPELEPETELEPGPGADAEPEPERESEPEPGLPAEDAGSPSPGNEQPLDSRTLAYGWLTPLLLLLLLIGILAFWWRWRAAKAVPTATTAVPPVFRLKLVGEGSPMPSDEGAGEIALRTVAGRIDLLLGRHAADILFDHPTVSRRHARLTGSADALWITDLGSSNGTRVNDRRCEPEQPTPLAPGDRLSLGAVECLVLAGAEESS